MKSVAWADSTDQHYNGAKCKLWVSSSRLAATFEGRVHIHGEPVPVTQVLNHLGADLIAPGRTAAHTGKLEARMSEVLASRWRLAHLPGPPGFRAQLLATKAIAKATRAVAFYRPHSTEL